LRESVEAVVRALIAQAWLETILTITGDRIAVAGVDSDMAMSSVENYGLMQCSVMGEQGMRTESRELIAGWGRGLGSGGRLGWDGDMMEGHGAVGDVTFRDSDMVYN
jgi:hypothetical protein